MAGSFLKLRLLAWINWISVDWNKHQAENAITENNFFSFSPQSALAVKSYNGWVEALGVNWIRECKPSK